MIGWGRRGPVPEGVRRPLELLVRRALADCGAWSLVGAVLAGWYLVGFRGRWRRGVIAGALSRGGWRADVALFGMTVLPSLCLLVGPDLLAVDSRSFMGLLDLRLEAAGGGSRRASRILLRDSLRLVPWQLGHLAVLRMTSARPGALRWRWISFLALGLGAADVGVLLSSRGEAALHDRISGTHVVRRHAGLGPPSSPTHPAG
ncbi:MAG: hypothetical protein ACREQM_19550 [Candidatus Dormibacteraceae bacterium]